MPAPLAAPLAVLLALAAQEATDTATFAADVKRAMPDFQLITSANTALLLEGDLAGATRKLLAAAPEGERTAAQAFLLGNLLYTLEPEVAYGLHEEAYNRAPDVQPVVQEWALEQHRAGKFAEAERLYAEVIAGLEPGSEGASRLHALRADCLLRLDRPEEACEAWRAVDVPRHHTAVEESASWVHGTPSPEARRCALLQRARGTGEGQAADPTAFDELILLDLHWERDWWNADVHPEYTAHDLALAQAALGADSSQYQTLAFLARWPASGQRFDFDDEIPKLKPPADHGEEIRAEAQALALIGEGARLPDDARLTSQAFRILIDNGVADAEQLLAWHGAELRKRAQSKRGDVEALRVLAGLYEQTWSDELEEWERFGWSRYSDVDSAVALLARKRDALRPRDLVLMQASAANPDDVRLCRLTLEAAEREGDLLVDPIARLAMAEFARLEECHRVDVLFRKLQVALRDRK